MVVTSMRTPMKFAFPKFDQLYVKALVNRQAYELEQTDEFVDYGILGTEALGFSSSSYLELSVRLGTGR